MQNCFLLSCERPKRDSQGVSCSVIYKGLFLKWQARVLSQVRALWDAVSSEHQDGARHLCQAEMYELLNNSSIVEQDAGIVAWSVPWPVCMCSLSLSLSLSPPPLLPFNTCTCETAQPALPDSLGDRCLSCCVHLSLSICLGKDRPWAVSPQVSNLQAKWA